MKNRFLILCLLLADSLLCGQGLYKNITGQVSFLSSQNVYVRFSSTAGISVHDTLYITSGEKLMPVLIINDLSPTSCLCTAISNEDLQVGHLIIARIIKPLAESRGPVNDQLKEVTPVTPKIENIRKDTAMMIPVPRKTRLGVRQNIYGSLSAASYSDFSNTAGSDKQRFRYTLSLNALNIADSPISAEAYVSFRHTSGEWNAVSKDIFSALKIYSLSLAWKIDSTSGVKLGRQINQRLSNIGSFDGLSAEKSVKRFTFGLTAGSRPGFKNYGFDFHLLQYGGYISYNHKPGKSFSSTSIAFMEQLYSGKTDRRFLYLQHSGSIGRNVTIFGSFEADLFKLVNNSPSTTLSLTSLFLYLNYRLSNGISVGASYDARKNPVYYETYKTLIDTLKESALRQSYRIHANIRLTSYLMLGVQSSYRYLKTDTRQSKSAGGYLTYSNQGKNYFSATLSGDYITTSYIKGYSEDLSFLKNIADGRIQLGAGYRYQRYKLPESLQDLTQHIGRADIYWQIQKKLFLSADYELTIEKSDRYNRFYLQLIKRF